MSDNPIENSSAGGGPSDDDAPVGNGVPPAWGERKRGMDPENRRRVLDRCAIRPGQGWITHFVLMMVLSVLIAVMGLSANSAALVIGAMLLAPLMTPVLGTAASLAMALGRPLKRSLIVLGLATAGAVALSYSVAIFLRDAPLTNEVLSRTSPDARDLIVALAAGAAGAYAMTRPDLSSALPGVAIAVALVPPLGVLGITLEDGRGDLASGAALLYATNLSAIVVAGVVVFVITGFVPPRRLALTSNRVLGGSVLALAFVIAAAVPLTLASFRAADEARDRRDVEVAVTNWLGGTRDRVDDIDIGDDRVDVRISGLEPPPATATLEGVVREILDNDVSLVVSWTQAQLAADREAEPTADELRALDVEDVVRRWLSSPDTGSYTISLLEIGEGSVRIDVTSAVAPPSIEDLSVRLEETLQVAPELEVNWLALTQILPGEPDETVSDNTERLTRVARDWAQAQTSLQILDVRYDGNAVEVDVVGVEAPDGEDLAELLQAEVVGELEVTIWFSERQLLVPAPTPTATPRPTATPVPTPVPTPEPTPEPTPTVEASE